MKSLTLVPVLVGAVLGGCGDNLHHGQSDASAGSDSGLPDARVDSSPDAAMCVPATVHPPVETLTRGELILDATQTENRVALTAPLDRSILITTMRENEPSPQFGAVICDLEAADSGSMTPAGIFCARPGAGTDSTTGGTGIVHVQYTVVTFTSGVTVQRGDANTGITNPITIALPTAADPSKSFVLLGGVISGGTGWGGNEFQRAHLLDANTLELKTAAVGSRVAWQVVTLDGATVQRGTASVASAATSGQATFTASATDPLLLASYNTDNTPGPAATLMLQSSVQNNVISFKRGLGGTALDIQWEAVSLPYFTRQVTTSFLPGDTTKTHPITNLAAASSIGLATTQAILGESSGSTDYNGADFDLVGEAAATITVADGAVTLDRDATSSNSSITWTAIDFAHDRCESN